MSALSLSRRELAERLLLLPSALEDQETAAIDAALVVRDRREALVQAEATVELTRCTNDLARKAAIRAATVAQRVALDQAEEEKLRAESALRVSNAKLASLRSVARLVTEMSE